MAGSKRSIGPRRHRLRRAGDFAEALRILGPIAEQGDVYTHTVLGNTHTVLGNMYEYGQGVPEDYVQAHMWFGVAGQYLRS
jgi:TPR repeat protein